jgi:hypothetical protein
MADVINESGMLFAADNTFRIEKSTLYTHMSAGIRSVEFIRIMDNTLLFIEAKTSFANPENPDDGNYANFLLSVNEICEKFIHSLNMYASVKAGVAGELLPDSFIPPEKVTLVFVLVIKNHEQDWCKGIEVKLRQALPPYLCKIWRPEVYVMNHETARKWHLIAN